MNGNGEEKKSSGYLACTYAGLGVGSVGCEGGLEGQERMDEDMNGIRETTGD